MFCLLLAKLKIDNVATHLQINTYSTIKEKA